MCREQEQKKGVQLELANVLNAIPFYTLIIDSDHRIVFANQAVKSQLQRSAEEIIGGYCPQVIHGQNHPIDKCPLEIAVQSGQAEEQEFFDENYQRWFSSAIYPIESTAHSDRLFFHMVHDITDRKEYEKKLKENNLRLARITESIIHALTMAVEYRDPYTAGHQQRVSHLSCAIARCMGLDNNRIEGIRIASSLHDIGKIGLPIEILSKPGNINELEFGLIKSHCQIGYEIMKRIEFPWPVAQTILQHHERVNGSGYPQGLTDDNILLEAKIIGLADVFEAMVSHRPYRTALSCTEALTEITKNRGILYDPVVVDTFINLLQEHKYELTNDIGSGQSSLFGNTLSLSKGCLQKG